MFRNVSNKICLSRHRERVLTQCALLFDVCRATYCKLALANTFTGFCQATKLPRLISVGIAQLTFTPLCTRIRKMTDYPSVGFQLRGMPRASSVRGTL